jgi:hypothetical protein
MSAVIFLIAIAGFFLGAVSVIFPLGFFHINNRKTAMLVVGGSIFVLVAAANSSPDPAPVARPEQVARVKPAISNGCDLAGAIPNCNEEVARLAAKEAALPPRPETTAPRNRSADRFVNEVLSAVQAEENARIADEARRGVAALERQRRLDEADAEVARTRADLENTIAEGKAKMRAADLEFQRTQYGVRVEQRNLDRLLHER